jgi:hypothetical protein
VEGERDERLESAGLVLQRPCAQHVIDAFFRRLDVPVQHRHIRPHPEAVSPAVSVEISVGSALVVADLLPNPLGEDFGAAARQRVEPCGHELAQDLLIAHAVEVGEKRDLDGREAFEMNPRTDAFETPQQIEVVVERQSGCS